MTAIFSDQFGYALLFPISIVILFWAWVTWKTTLKRKS